MEELITKKEIMNTLRCKDTKALQILKMEQTNGFKIGKFWYCKKSDFENLLELAKYGGIDILY